MAHSFFRKVISCQDEKKGLAHFFKKKPTDAASRRRSIDDSRRDFVRCKSVVDIIKLNLDFPLN